MAQWMINCKDYAGLVSEQMERPLSLKDRMTLKIHQLVCPACNYMRKQLDVIRHACRHVPSGDEQDTHREDCVLPEDVQSRIKSAFKDLSK